MATQWTLVKISQATRQRLERVRDSMLLAECIGLRQLDRDPRDRVSLDQVIGLLIDMRDKHAERRKRSRRKPKVPLNGDLVAEAEVDTAYWRELLGAAVDPEPHPKKGC